MIKVWSNQLSSSYTKSSPNGSKSSIESFLGMSMVCGLPQKTFDTFVGCLPIFLPEEVKLNPMLYHRKILIPFVTRREKGYPEQRFFPRSNPFCERGFSQRKTCGGGQGDYLRARRFLFGQCLCSQSQGRSFCLGYRYNPDPDLKDISSNCGQRNQSFVW